MSADLAARYGQERLPRYTSYPTAPHFSKAVGPDAYAHWLASIQPDGAASLYLHVPFCRSMCLYCGCHTSITGRDEPVAAYISTLRREIALVAGRIGRRLPVDHIHFGGGTPTIMAPEMFVGLVSLMRDSFLVSPDAEIAVEIDPRTLAPEMVAAMAHSGVTRASLGVQSFDPVVQRAINRIQSLEQTAAVTDDLRRGRVAGINFDLIYGLPYQTVESCLDTVEKCVELRPDRLSVFGYAHVPTFKKHQRKIADRTLPDGPERHRQSIAIAEALKKAGYLQIGLDHFALPGDPMADAMTRGRLRRNFQGYTTDASKLLLGFGASAIGQLEHGYVQNEVGIRTYLDRVDEGKLATAKGFALSDDDRLRAEIIERIMCDFGADLGLICARHGTSAEAVLNASGRLDDLVSDGIVELEGASLRVPERSRFLVRIVAAAFDGYLDKSMRVHSPAV